MQTNRTTITSACQRAQQAPALQWTVWESDPSSRSPSDPAPAVASAPSARDHISPTATMRGPEHEKHHDIRRSPDTTKLATLALTRPHELHFPGPVSATLTFEAIAADPKSGWRVRSTIDQPRCRALTGSGSRNPTWHSALATASNAVWPDPAPFSNAPTPVGRGWRGTARHEAAPNSRSSRPSSSATANFSALSGCHASTRRCTSGGHAPPASASTSPSHNSTRTDGYNVLLIGQRKQHTSACRHTSQTAVRVQAHPILRRTNTRVFDHGHPWHLSHSTPATRSTAPQEIGSISMMTTSAATSIASDMYRPALRNTAPVGRHPDSYACADSAKTSLRRDDDADRAAAQAKSDTL